MVKVKLPQTLCDKRNRTRFGCTHHRLNSLQYRWGVADTLKHMTGKALCDEFAIEHESEWSEIVDMTASFCRMRFPCQGVTPCFEAKPFDLRIIDLLADI